MTSFGPFGLSLGALLANSGCIGPSPDPVGVFWIALPLVSFFLALVALSIRLWLRPEQPRRLGLSIAGVAAWAIWGLSILGALIGLAFTISFVGDLPTDSTQSMERITTLVKIWVPTGFLMLTSVRVVRSDRMRSYVAEVSASGGRARRIGMFVGPGLAVYALLPTILALIVLFSTLFFGPCSYYEPR